jgi:FkbM family methyltransferase
MLISYAQNFEDVMLWRALGQVKAGFPKGFYIDVGAQDPVVDSVSLAFYEHGWRGIHVEPTPRYAEMLRQRRPDETVIQSAVGTGRATRRFFEIPDTGLSTADPKIAQQHRSAGFTVNEISVSSMTLAAIFKSCAGRQIHWMKIDVEGGEHDVLRSWQSSKARPWIVVVENTLPLTQIETHATWEPLLLRRGYTHVYSDGLNRYYVSGDHPELREAFRTGPNLFDQFALSGTSSAPFCSLLAGKFNSELQQKTQELDARREREQALVAENRRLGEKVGELRNAAAPDIAARAARDQQFVSKLEDARQVALRMAQIAAERERTFSTTIQEVQQVALRMSQTSAERVQRLSEAVDASRSELSSQMAVLAELRMQLLASQGEASRLSRQMSVREQEFEASTAKAETEIGRMSATLDSHGEALNMLVQVVQDELANSAQALSTLSGPVFEASPTDRYRLRDLTRFNDRAFVEAAYQALLCRAPDPDGMTFYLNRLRAGMGKELILGEIASSRECKSIGAKVSGLAAAYALRRATALPFVGRVVRLFLFVLHLPDLARDGADQARGNALAGDRLRAFAGNATAALQKARQLLDPQGGGKAPYAPSRARVAAGDGAQDPLPSILSQHIELGGQSPENAIGALATLLSQSREARDLRSR